MREVPLKKISNTQFPLRRCITTVTRSSWTPPWSNCNIKVVRTPHGVWSDKLVARDGFLTVWIDKMDYGCIALRVRVECALCVVEKIGSEGAEVRLDIIGGKTENTCKQFLSFLNETSVHLYCSCSGDVQRDKQERTGMKLSGTGRVFIIK